MTQSDHVLDLLRTGSKTTADFCQTTLSREYPRVIFHLRRKGYVITTERVRKGCWRFTLVSEPAVIEANGQLAFAGINTLDNETPHA